MRRPQSLHLTPQGLAPCMCMAFATRAESFNQDRQFSGGVIRAQLRRAEKVEFQVTMSTANEVPPIAGVDASGPAKFSTWVLRGDDGAPVSAVSLFDVNFRLPAPSTVTGLHIHDGA